MCDNAATGDAYNKSAGRVGMLATLQQGAEIKKRNTPFQSSFKSHLILHNVDDHVDQQDDLLFIGAHERPLHTGRRHVQHANVVRTDHVDALNAHREWQAVPCRVPRNHAHHVLVCFVEQSYRWSLVTSR